MTAAVSKSGSDRGAHDRGHYLERYREKKRRRLHAKSIRYHKRKVNADNRYTSATHFVCWS